MIEEVGILAAADYATTRDRLPDARQELEPCCDQPAAEQALQLRAPDERAPKIRTVPAPNDGTIT